MGIDMTTTCGPLFKQAFEYAQKESRDGLEFFSWGHLTGQAEKVWLGTCSAFMVRPSSIGDIERPVESRLRQRVQAITEIYGLEHEAILTNRGVEYWVFRRDKYDLIRLLMEDPNDSKMAHFIRGVLCGVPASELDLHFHRRYL